MHFDILVWGKSTSFQSINFLLFRYGITSLQKFEDLEKADFKKPLMVKEHNSAESAMIQEAFIDVDNVFSPEDKLSQVNTLLQMGDIEMHIYAKQACIKNTSCS